jgi:hypothetical protein
MEFKEYKKGKSDLLNYVPTTMDELMSRFVFNIERSGMKEQFEDARQLLAQPSLLEETDEDIKQSVKESLGALQDMMFQDMFSDTKLANTQNGLYLKQLAQATKEGNLQLIKCGEGLNKCIIVRK